MKLRKKNGKVKLKEILFRIIKIIVPIVVGIVVLFGVVKLCLYTRDIIYKDRANDLEFLRDNTELVINKTLGKNIYEVKTVDYVNIFNLKYQKAVDEDINELLETGNYTMENPLIVYNAYGITPGSVNVYFNTSDDEMIDYTVSVREDSIGDYSKSLKGSSNEHSYQLIGLVIGYKNIVTLKSSSDTTLFSIDLSTVTSNSQVFADSAKVSDEELSNGLFTIQGNDSKGQDYIALYDNDGVLRGEYLIKDYRSHKILFNDDKMYFSISKHEFVEVNNLGMITNKFNLGDYELHHDYVFDDDHNIISLATDMRQDSVEDIIIKIDVKTKEVTELLDLGDILPEYKKICFFDEVNGNSDGEKGLDWIHINTIQFVDGDIIISSRETSSILKINDIESKPKLSYILGEKSVWEKTSYKDYVYSKDGDFVISGGQHAVTYLDNDDDNDATYYLYMFNNNYGKATTRPDFDWTSIGFTNVISPFVGDSSQYYKYEVNEDDKTFKLVDSFDVPYSGVVSSAQTMPNGNIVVDSGVKGEFIEYNSDGEKISIYKLNMNKYFIYRVLKYDFNGFYYE